MSEWIRDDEAQQWVMHIGDNIRAVAWDRGEWSVYAAGAHERAYLAGGWAPDDTLAGAMRGATDALRALGRSLLAAAGDEGDEWGMAEELVDDGSELAAPDPADELAAAAMWVETKIADVALVIDDGGPSLILGAPDRSPSVMVACRRCSATMRLREVGSEWLVCDCPGREVRRSTFADMMPEAVRAMFYVP